MRNGTMIFLLSVAAAMPAFADPEVSRAVNLKHARGRVQRVVVDIPAGEFRIRNGDPSALTVEGELSHHYDGWRSRDRAQRILDDSDIEIVIDGTTALIRRRLGPNARGWRGRNMTSVDLRVALPTDLDLDLGTRFGEVKIDGTFRSVRAHLSAGEIEFRAPRNSVGELNASCRVGEVRAHLGDRTLSREGIFPGAAHFINAGGKGLVNLHVTAGAVQVRLTR